MLFIQFSHIDENDKHNPLYENHFFISIHTGEIYSVVLNLTILFEFFDVDV